MESPCLHSCENCSHREQIVYKDVSSIAKLLVTGIMDLGEEASLTRLLWKLGDRGMSKEKLEEYKRLLERVLMQLVITKYVKETIEYVGTFWKPQLVIYKKAKDILTDTVVISIPVITTRSIRNLQLKKSPKSESATSTKKSPTSNTCQKTLQLFQEGNSIEEISTLRSIKSWTIIDHLIKNIPHPAITYSKFMTTEEYTAIIAVIDKNDEDSKLRVLKDALPDTISYDKIKLALGLYRSGKKIQNTVTPINVYTDGACTNNGQPDAKAGLGVYFSKYDPRNCSERISGKQTNNAAELKAIIRVASILVQEMKKGVPLHIYSDSTYAIGCCTTYGEKLELVGWKKKKPIPNIELVKDAYYKFKDFTNVKFHHIEAHTGKGDVHSLGNEGADELACLATNKICPEPVESPPPKPSNNDLVLYSKLHQFCLKTNTKIKDELLLRIIDEKPQNMSALTNISSIKFLHQYGNNIISILNSHRPGTIESYFRKSR